MHKYYDTNGHEDDSHKWTHKPTHLKKKKKIYVEFLLRIIGLS